MLEVNKSDSKKFADFDSLEKKLELVLEQQDAIQTAIAHLKADLRELVREAVKSAINKHSTEGYGKIATGATK